MTQTSTSNTLNPRFPRPPFYPNGIPEADQHAPGAKLDAGKPRTGLVLHGFAKALTEVAKVGTFGAKKYTDNGWMEVQDGANRYGDAMYRHLLAYAEGEAVDTESQLPHLAHAAWNALARLQLELQDDNGGT